MYRISTLIKFVLQNKDSQNIKKLLFFLAVFFAFSLTLTSQDIKEAKKLMKDAEKALSNYNLDKIANYAQLDEGIKAIDNALQNGELAGTSAG